MSNECESESANNYHLSLTSIHAKKIRITRQTSCMGASDGPMYFFYQSGEKNAELSMSATFTGKNQGKLSSIKIHFYALVDGKTGEINHELTNYEIIGDRLASETKQKVSQIVSELFQMKEVNSYIKSRCDEFKTLISSEKNLKP